MAVPYDFTQLCKLFYQYSRNEFSSESEWIAATVGYLGKGPKTAVKKFLDDLLAGNPTDAELRRIWQDTSPDYDFYDDEGAREFFIKLHSEVTRQLG